MTTYRGIYHKKNVEKGAIYIRTQRNIVSPATEVLSTIYDNFSKAVTFTYNDTSVTSQLASGIKDFEVWFDTLMVQTDDYIFLTKIDFNYDTNIISNTLDDIHIIPLNKSKFGSTWFFPENKRVTLCTLVSCGTNILPVLRTYDLENNIVSFIYNSSVDLGYSAYNFNTFEEPILSYNYKTKTYNIAFIAYSGDSQYNTGSFNGMFTNIINIQDMGNTYMITKSDTIIPTILQG